MPYSPDDSKDLACSLVAVAPSPATSGTSLIVTPGEGAFFPDTPGWDGLIWTDGALPLHGSAERFRCTAGGGVSGGDTLTIVRAQGGTSAIAITVGMRIAAVWSSAAIKALQAAVTANTAAIAGNSTAIAAKVASVTAADASITIGGTPTAPTIHANVPTIADSSTTVKGIVELATAPVSPTLPIAVGDNDPRNSNARTPTAHKASHATGGSDVLLPSDIGAALGLVPTVLKSASYTLTAGDYVAWDASGGSLTGTLPTAPADKTRVGGKLVATAIPALASGFSSQPANTVTLAAGGSDVFDVAGGSASMRLTVLGESVILQYAAGSPGVWTVQARDVPPSRTDRRYAPAPMPSRLDRLSPGRQWSSNFSVADQDAAMFDLVNFARGTDAALAAPTGVTATPVVGGGTFGAGAQFWKVAAGDATGVTAASAEATATIAAGGSATIAWTALPAADLFYVFRSSATGGESGATQLVAVVPGNTYTYTDTGSALVAGSASAVSSTASRTFIATANSNNPSTCLLHGQSIKNVDVLMSYRIVNDATYGLADPIIAALARYVAPVSGTSITQVFESCMVGGDSHFNTAVSPTGLFLQSNVNGVSGLYGSAVATIASPLAVDTTTRYLRLRVVDDALYLKNWSAGVLEPDGWQIISRSRPAGSPMPGQTPTLNVDDISMGTAGVFTQLTAAKVYAVTITELVAKRNGLTNQTFKDVENGASLPLAWNTSPTSVPSGCTVGPVNVADRLGRTRKAMQIVVPSGGSPGGLLLTQRVFNALCRTSSLDGIARLSPSPNMALDDWLEISIWSKATGITNPAPSSLFGGAGLAAASDNYYYNTLGQTANRTPDDGLGDYFDRLGPPANGGLGAWDWFQTVKIIPVRHPNSVAYIDIGWGFHDAAATGTLLLMDPEVRPVG